MRKQFSARYHLMRIGVRAAVRQMQYSLYSMEENPRHPAPFSGNNLRSARGQAKQSAI